MFGIIFYLFNVDLNDESNNVNSNYNDIKLSLKNNSNGVQNQNINDLMLGEDHDNNFLTQFMPGPPFVFGSMMVIVAILVAAFIKDDHPDAKRSSIVGEKKSIVEFCLFLILSRNCC